MGTQLPLPKKGAKPQTAAWIKMKLGTEVGLSPDDIVLDVDPAPPPQKVGAVPLPNFQPMSIVAKRLYQDGTWRGCGPWCSHVVLDGDPATLPKKGPEPPIFGPFLLWPNGWIHQDATCCGGRPPPRRLCVGRASSPFTKRGGAPQFSAHVYCGQTAE